MDKSALPIPTDAEAVAGLSAARARAAVALDDVIYALHLKAIEPGNSTKQLLDMGEHFYKVSGLSAKQEKVTAGPGFSITINIPGQERVIGGSVVVEQAPQLDEPSGVTLMMIPMDDALDCGEFE